MHDRLVKNHMIAWPVIFFQQSLTSQPRLNTLLNYVWIHFRCYSSDDAFGVSPSLQQAGNVINRITGNSYGFLFQANKRVQIEVGILCPPAWFTSFSGEAHEFT